MNGYSDPYCFYEISDLIDFQQFPVPDEDQWTNLDLDCPTVNGHISAYRIVCQQILPVVAWKSWCKQCNSIATHFLLWSVILYNSLRFVIGHHLFTLALICHCTRDHLPGKLVQVTDCYRWKTLLQNGDRLDWAEYHERKFSSFVAKSPNIKVEKVSQNILISGKKYVLTSCVSDVLNKS